MTKNPKLALVNSDKSNRPPRKLGGHGMALWNCITSEYVIDDRGGVEILMQICAASDRVEALAAEIDRDGETIRTKAGLRSHPCLKEELALRAFICRGLQRLGLNVETVKPIGRPPGAGYGGT